MSTNGVAEELWGENMFRITEQDVRVMRLTRDADGYYTGIISAQVTIELADGRHIVLNDARSFRGRCLNARKGRKAKSR